LDYTCGARAVDAATEGEDIAGFGLENDVLVIDSAFNASGLIGPLEMSFDLSAVLLDLNFFGGCGPVGVVAIEVPFACGLRWRLVWGRLLRYSPKGRDEEDPKIKSEEAPRNAVHGLLLVQ
jgi:hypothetical protein